MGTTQQPICFTSTAPTLPRTGTCSTSIAIPSCLISSSAAAHRSWVGSSLLTDSVCRLCCCRSSTARLAAAGSPAATSASAALIDASGPPPESAARRKCTVAAARSFTLSA